MANTRAPRFVLDCSVVLSWYFADESDPFADAVAASLTGSTAVVPSLFHLEIANILVVGERRKRSTEAQAAAFLASMAALPIVVDDQTGTRAWAETIDLARAYGLSAYDAAYLELASRESLPIATLDDRLKSAAKSAGVPFFKP
ncbi:MAG TPA: type II toxin-antitoxin system VapC family toxin [Gemmataceae bacterium]|nr:type II toxin-antitoxin system VapC family toxin [Gemmataceae bacterium]